MSDVRDEHPNFADTLEQLRAVADGRGSAPEKTEQHPDAELLRAVARYLDLCAEASSIQREARQHPSPYVGTPAFDAARFQWKEKEREAQCILNRLGKMRAVTAAGVFAKATIVVTQRGAMSAPKFMLSLATDLVSNPTLRSSLWPVQVA
jgi:hypothetical protein